MDLRKSIFQCQVGGIRFRREHLRRRRRGRVREVAQDRAGRSLQPPPSRAGRSENRAASGAALMSSRIRPKAWLSHHRPGTGSFKYHFNVHVHDVVLREGMLVPEGAKFRLVWKRGDKVASSRELAQASPMMFDESLSLVCTMYRDPALGAYAEKEAAFALHMTGPRAGSTTRQLARATLDLSKWAGIEAISEELKLVLLHDGVPVGDVRLTLTLTLTTLTLTLPTLTLTLRRQP